MRGPAPTKPVLAKKVAFIQPKFKQAKPGAPRSAVPIQTRPIDVGGEIVGGSALTWIVGPEFVESSAQMVTVGHALQELGVKFIRAAVVRPERHGENFRGLGAVGLKLLKATAERFQLQVVTEVHEIKEIPLVAEYADVIEVCPKSVSNVGLLGELAFLEKTVIFQRSPMMTFDEYLGLLPYLEKGGRVKIILADSGVVSFDGRLNRMLDLSSLISLKRETSHPVFVDCCAAAFDWSYTEKLASAAIAAGVDGVMAEMHLGGSALPASKKALVQEELAGMIWRAKALKSTLNALVHGDPHV